MSMLSVGIFTYSSKPRGSVVHAACLAEALERAGARVKLYALSKAGDDFYRTLACPLRLIPAAPAPSDVDQLIAQRSAEFQRGFAELGVRHDIYHAEDCLSGSALVGVKAKLGGAIVRTVHHVERYESSYLMACQARSITQADLVLSVSEATRREVKTNFGIDAPVISNGVDVARFALPASKACAALVERLGIQAGDRVVASVGGVEPRKNSLILLKAIALAHAREPRLRWLVAGGASIWQHDEYRRAFAARLAELPLELRARIHLLGTVSEDELTAVYQLSELLLCASLQEGFGLCVLEALAAKAAVIVPRGAPFDEYLDAASAWFVDPRSPTEIAGALGALLAEPTTLRCSAERGYELARRYSWERVAQSHLARYETLHGRARRAGELSTI
ncbi:MAG TPA: MSMEG_0565 family glycosyltransferase [Polyangiaceae bacterium]|jgi:glycosyltransferase-like protein|nr:MSMEG_0565 family glycosyltransferase [Polyangiaceae bacterium]